MRKALITMILAATAATPVAAWAQDEDNTRVERVRQRIEQRQQARTERQEQRSETPRVERQARQEPQVQTQPVVRRAPRGDRNWQRREARQEPQVQTEQVVQRERRGDRNVPRTDDGQRTSAYPSAWQGDPNDPRRARYERLERRNQYRNGTQEQRQDVREEWRSRPELRQERRTETRRDRRDRRRDWNRTSWRNDNRYDWQSWRYRNRSLFRLSPYYSPFRSHRYSRFSIGLFLQPSYYSQRYWLSDPWQYRLPYAPPGTQWVRYYNDVLLVDTWSGEVIDVIYDFFW